MTRRAKRATYRKWDPWFELSKSISSAFGGCWYRWYELTVGMTMSLLPLATRAGWAIRLSQSNLPSVCVPYSRAAARCAAIVSSLTRTSWSGENMIGSHMSSPSSSTLVKGGNVGGLQDTAAGSGAHQDKAPHQAGAVVGDLVGDLAAHGVAEDVGGRQAEAVDEAGGAA